MSDAQQRTIVTKTAAELITLAGTRPPEPVIEGLLNCGDVALLHGYEESFKSVFVVQLAESVAAGRWFLDRWRVPRQFRVGVIETEIHEVMLGKRLQSMFPSAPPPESLHFLGEDGMKELRRQGSMALKCAYVNRWVKQEGIEVVIFDTANDFFRGDDNPSAEADVGAFFDLLRNMPVKARILVRHDRKKKEQDGDEGNTNELIRGSAEWKEDPELILYVKRSDKRTNRIDFQVGKFRYGAKPEPMELWFDAGTFRLTALPPVIALLESGGKSRQQLVTLGGHRFGLGERSVALQLEELGGFLFPEQRGHQKFYEIDWERAVSAPWGEMLRRRGEDMQPCTTTTLTSTEPLATNGLTMLAQFLSSQQENG